MARTSSSVRRGASAITSAARSIDLSGVPDAGAGRGRPHGRYGFLYDDIAGIVGACPAKRQTLLFSATYPDDIRRASSAFLKQPAEVKVEALHADSQIDRAALQGQ